MKCEFLSFSFGHNKNSDVNLCPSHTTKELSFFHPFFQPRLVYVEDVLLISFSPRLIYLITGNFHNSYIKGHIVRHYLNVFYI